MNINPFDILKNAEALQQQLGSMQEKLAGICVTGSAGGGMVEIELSGAFEMLDVRLAPELAGDTQMTQDLVMAAYTNAMEKAKAAITSELGALAGGSLGGLGNIAQFLGGGAR